MSISKHYHGFLPYQSRAIFRDLNGTALDPRNRASCGIFSLHHAMVFLGQGTRFQWLRDEHPRFLDKIYFGTESAQLAALAKRMGLRPAIHASSRRTAPIRRELDRSLAEGHPVIVGSEPWCHWICVGGRTEGGGYIWADSADDPAVGIFGSWDELEEWITGEAEGFELELPIEIIRIAPGRKMPPRRSMVPWVDGIWRNLAADPGYAKDWSNLLADMLDVFWDLDYAPGGRSAGEFLDEHLDGIVAAVSYHLECDPADVRETAHGYRDVADFHSLVVPRGEEACATAAFALKLASKALY